MNILEVTKKLISFKTETGNIQEIKNCIDYCTSLFKDLPVHIEIFNISNVSPVLFISNTNADSYDVITIGHLDVVPAKEDMYTPIIKDGKMFARGALDMKAFAAVQFNTLEYIIKNNINIKFGVMLSTDEEKAGLCTPSFLNSHPNFKADIVLDNDVGGDITEIINKYKNIVLVKLIAKGVEAHGSTPWEGFDANEMMIRTLSNLRKYFPYFDNTKPAPQDTWINTMHIAKLHGGNVDNIICGNSEATLDFRLTENTNVQDLEKTISSCLEKGVNYEIQMQAHTVMVNENNPIIQEYKKVAEDILQTKTKLTQLGGATDSRNFVKMGATIIIHSGTGQGMHGDNEYLVLESLEQLSKIQIKFIESLASKK